MPPHSHLAIEIGLVLIDNDPDDTRRAAPLRVLHHINGTLSEAETRARYAACDAILSAPACATQKESA